MPTVKPLGPFIAQRREALKAKPVTQKGWEGVRRIVRPQEKKELMDAIKKELMKPEFSSTWGKDGYGDRIKAFSYKGKGVLLKLVLEERHGLADHGKDPELLRHAILEHQKAVRTGAIDASKYVLVTPKLYGKIGHVVVMEQMLVVQRLSQLDHKTSVKVIAARNQLGENLWKLFEAGRLLKNEAGITPIPQASGIMYLGEMNGRVILSLPYDVH